MNKKNNDGFYLAIGMFLVVSICVIFAMCGKEIISEVDMFDKVIGYILKGLGLAIAVTFLVWGIKLYVCDFNKIDEWTFSSKIENGKKYTSIIFDNDSVFTNHKYIEKVVCYLDNSKIKSKAFSNCKKLKQITFYKNPKTIANDAFLGCSKLSCITIYGKKEDWEKHKIIIPSNPKIEFISCPENKTTINKTEIDLKCNGTINIKNN